MTAFHIALDDVRDVRLAKWEESAKVMSLPIFLARASDSERRPKCIKRLRRRRRILISGVMKGGSEVEVVMDLRGKKLLRRERKWE